MNKPNFFLLGAAKSGTTSLYAYLKKHPEIFMSAVKEPSFFCEYFNVIKDPITYFNLFNKAKNETCLGEASHVYLTNPTSAAILHGLFPDAKFILILRNPVDRAYSLYEHMKRFGYETASTFEKALLREEERFCSDSFKRNCQQYYYNYFYYRSGLYTEQLKRYYEFFSPGNFLILTLAQIKTKPEKTVRSMYAFLGVDTEFIPAITLENQAQKGIRNTGLNHFVKVGRGKDLKKNFPWIYNIFNRVNNSWNMIPKPILRSDTHEALLNKYRKDMPDLKELSGYTLEEL